MDNQALRVAWYRSSATFGRSVGGQLALVVFVGPIGGLTLGSLIAARRSESSAPSDPATADPSDLLGQPSTTVTCSSGFVTKVGKLDGVKRVACARSPKAETLNPDDSVATILLTDAESAARSSPALVLRSE